MKEKNNKLSLFNQISNANNLNITSNYHINIDIDKINNLNILNSIKKINGLEALKEVITYHDEEKKIIKSICHYNVTGKLHGKTEGFYRNGKKHYELNYINGKLHGRQFINWVNQKPFIEFNYFNGKPEGMQVEYSVSGSVQWKVFLCGSSNVNKKNSKPQNPDSEVNLLCND
jgi:antitoxin component YwqK of YwqJK toxin-antitoxin module